MTRRTSSAGTPSATWRAPAWTRPVTNGVRTSGSSAPAVDQGGADDIAELVVQLTRTRAWHSFGRSSEESRIIAVCPDTAESSVEEI